MKIFSYHKETGMFWFRIFGKGLHFIDRDIHAPLFSRRNGYTKVLFTYKSWDASVLK